MSWEGDEALFSFTTCVAISDHYANIAGSMCGIAGAVGAIEPSLETSVRAMMDAQVHRGPDSEGLFATAVGPGVILGFRRLAILDLSPNGHQPMVDERRGNVIVFNGEIYNFAELRADLVAQGETFRSTGDTEVLLRAYGLWGEAMVTRLRGMYAFAVWDARRRQAFLARDRLGIKPLYYAVVRRPGGNTLLFASEVRALVATGLVPRRLDARGVATYLWNGFVVGPSTIVEGVSLLPSGTSLTISVDDPQACPRRYWSHADRSMLPREDAVAVLEHELLTAARQHLVSDVPLGVFLSGAWIRALWPRLRFASEANESRPSTSSSKRRALTKSIYARKVAESLGTEHAEFTLTQAHFRVRLDEALQGLDQPTFDAINTYFVSRVVREAGFTVALAGTGGDELFGGYASFRDLPKSLRLSRVARFLTPVLARFMAAIVMRATVGKGGEVPPQARWGKSADLVATRGDDVSLYQVMHGLFTGDFLGELAMPSMLDLAPYGLPPERADEIAAMVKSGTRLAAVARMELALFVGERLLRDSDVASMATSLELRLPFLDHGVVEAVEAVSDAARFAPLGKKQLLKKLAMPSLDPALFDRPKSGFVLPLKVWAKNELSGLIEALFAERALVESVGLNPDALARLWRAFRAGAPGLYWSRVWAPFVLLDYCRRQQLSLH